MSEILISDGFDYPVGKPDAVGYKDKNSFKDTSVNGKPHLGEDWNLINGDDLGDPVYAVSNGIVIFARNPQPEWGNIVIIKHTLPDGRQIYSMYAHLQKIQVKVNDVVERGNKIGTIGDADGKYAAHLHFEIRNDSCIAKARPGPGYSFNYSGWEHPTNFIRVHRKLFKLHAQYIKQDPAPTLMVGGPAKKWSIQFKNISNVDWENTNNNNQLMVLALGTYDKPKTQKNHGLNYNWYKPNRLAKLKESLVKPGEVGTFEFELKAPLGTEPQTYIIKFTPKNPQGYFNNQDSAEHNCFVTVTVINSVSKKSQTQQQNIEMTPASQNIAAYQNTVFTDKIANTPLQQCPTKPITKNNNLKSNSNASSNSNTTNNSTTNNDATTSADTNTNADSANNSDPTTNTGTTNTSTTTSTDTTTNASSTSNSAASAQPANTDNYTLVVYDEESKNGNRHYSSKLNLLEVVQKDVKDKVTIHYSNPNGSIPDELAVIRDGESLPNILGKARAGGKLYTLAAFYHPNVSIYTFSRENLFQRLFTKNLKPTIFELKGLPSPIKVKAYCPDQWKLSIRLPKLPQMNLGVKLENKKTNIVKSDEGLSQKATGNEVIFTARSEQIGWKKSTEQTISASYGKYTHSLKSDELYYRADAQVFTLISKGETKFDSPIKLTLNGELIKVDFVDFIAGLLDLITNFNEAIRAFKDNVPKVGWYIDFDCQILQGTFDIAWGWREDKSYQAYYYLGAAANIKLFEITFEIGFGFEYRGVVAQICVNMTGKSDLAFGMETIGPATDSVDLGTLTNVIGAGGYVRVEAGKYVKIEGGIESTITLKDKINLNLKKGFSINGEAKWDGVSVKLTAQIWGINKVWKGQLLKPQELGKYKFPDGNKKKRNEIKSVLEVSKIVEKTLTEGWDLRVFEKVFITKRRLLGSGTYIDEDWSRLSDSVVADTIAMRIWKEKDKLLLDEKSINGLAHAIRKDCDVIAVKDYARDWMSFTELSQYLNGSKMASLLHQARDPSKYLENTLNQNSQ